jgi:hypothetical protein
MWNRGDNEDIQRGWLEMSNWRGWRNEQLIHPKLANTVQKPPRTESQAWRPPFGGGPGTAEAGTFSRSVGGRVGAVFSGSACARIGEGGVEVEDGVSSGLDIVNRFEGFAGELKRWIF